MKALNRFLDAVLPNFDSIHVSITPQDVDRILVELEYFDIR